MSFNTLPAARSDEARLTRLADCGPRPRVYLAIALSWAALFFFAYPSFSFLAKSRVLNGLAYGLLIWLTMNLLVVPMSRIPARPFVLQNIVIGMLILMVMVGMPVAFIVPKYYMRRRHGADAKLLVDTVPTRRR